MRSRLPLVHLVISLTGIFVAFFATETWYSYLKKIFPFTRASALQLHAADRSPTFVFPETAILIQHAEKFKESVLRKRRVGNHVQQFCRILKVPRIYRRP